MHRMTVNEVTELDVDRVNPRVNHRLTRGSSQPTGLPDPRVNHRLNRVGSNFFNSWLVESCPVFVQEANLKKLVMPRPAYGALSVTALIGLVTLTFGLLTCK